MNYTFKMDCVHSHSGQDINDMVDMAREITWNTIKKHITIDELRSIFPLSAYSYRREHYNPITGEQTFPMHLKDDYAVSFWKSKYRGELCYYIVQSGIEYIFTRG